MLVDAELGSTELDALVGDGDDVAVAAITAAELMVGVELAEGNRREERARFVEAVLGAVTVEPYDLEVAAAHAALLVHARRGGRPRGPHDLIIAATARARKRAVVTADRTGFEDLPDVGLREMIDS